MTLGYFSCHKSFVQTSKIVFLSFLVLRKIANLVTQLSHLNVIVPILLIKNMLSESSKKIR